MKNFSCTCGKNKITLSFSEGMPAEVVEKVYCPQCETNGHPHQKAWPVAGDWFLHFDMEVAKMFTMAKLAIDPTLVNPGFIVDRGFVQ